MLEKKSKILTILFACGIAASVIFTAYRFLVARDFVIEQVPEESDEETLETSELDVVPMESEASEPLPSESSETSGR